MNIYDLSEGQGTSIRKFLDFTLFSNPLGPSHKAKHALRECVKKVAQFPDPQARQLRKLIAGMDGVAPENILFGQGSTQLLELLVAVLKPATVLIPFPVISRYEDIFLTHSCTIIPFALSAENGFAFDTAGFISRVDAADLVLIPNPHHLTGTIVSPEDLRRIIDHTQATAKMIVFDESFIDYTGSPSIAANTLQSPNTLVLKTFSLFHALAGLRLGYAVALPEVLNRMRTAINPEPPNSMIAAAALVSLKDKGFVKRTSDFLREEKVYLMEKLAKIKNVHITDTRCNFLLLSLQIPHAELESSFLKRNILISCFEDAHKRSFITLPIRRRPANAQFVKVLRRIAEVPATQ